MANVKRVFMVDGKPFFPLGGQAHNSSGYSTGTSEMAFKATKLLHGNTLEIPLYWDKIEPKEGKFDFTTVDELIASARRYDVKLILLWFGTWKNAKMDYVPSWMKTNSQRFKRAISYDGSELWVLSAYCPANLEADKKAFAALCKHLKAKDSVERTVIGLQVENEPGISGSNRDYGPEAQAACESPAPAKLFKDMKAAGKGYIYDLWQKAGGKNCGTWSEVFGYVAHDIVDAWSIAAYIDAVAEAGKAVYDIPMFINGSVGVIGNWRGNIPDEIFSSGGPIPKVLDIYKWFTPHIDLIAPDIHTRHSRGYEAACAYYNREDNPLFECESGPNTRDMFRAIADYNSIGYFFFGNDKIVAEDGGVRPESQVMVDSVRCIAAVIPLLLKYQGTGKVHAVDQEENMAQQGLEFEGYLGRVQFGAGHGPMPSKDWHHSSGMFTREQPVDNNRSRGLIIQASKYEFYLVGANYSLFLRPKYSPGKIRPVQLHNDTADSHQITVDEGHFSQNGEFVVDRARNGDELSSPGVWVEPDCGVVRVVMCD